MLLVKSMENFNREKYLHKDPLMLVSMTLLIIVVADDLGLILYRNLCSIRQKSSH